MRLRELLGLRCDAENRVVASRLELDAPKPKAEGVSAITGAGVEAPDVRKELPIISRRVMGR
jgi:hypothetical protein